MGSAIGEVFPPAIGVAISPVPIIAIVLMLGTPRARQNGPRSRLTIAGDLLLALASGNSQDVEGAAHGEPGRAARGRAADARHRLALLRRARADRRTLIRERMSAAEFERFLARLVPLPEPRADATNGGHAVRNVERVHEAIATAYRATPDLANITGTR